MIESLLGLFQSTPDSGTNSSNLLLYLVCVIPKQVVGMIHNCHDVILSTNYDLY